MFLVHLNPCIAKGHEWICVGGTNCGCPDGSCSVPVRECSRCGACDYGDNDDASLIRKRCLEKE